MTLTPAWKHAWAHARIDAGAGLFVEHGEPLLHGIEIYHGRPIFYGLGNFIFQTRTQDKWKGPEIWESVIASLQFSGGRVTSLRLTPIALNPQGEPGPRWLETRGWPRPAEGAEARSILGRIQALSARYGTRWVAAGDSALTADLR
jgi:poly-gamma-glutamate synthesis protein (capsule biosynthesis protein)